MIPSLFRENKQFSEPMCEMLVLLRTNMQVLLNYKNVLIAIYRMRFVPYVCNVLFGFFFSGT